MRELPNDSLGYRSELDGIRAVAVVAVVGVHYAGQWRWGLAGGGLGVNVFFVLSGFLITRLLIEEFVRTGSVRLGSFYRRRLARLLPALLLVIALVAGLEFGLAVYGDGGAVSRDMFTSLLYVQNWARFIGAGGPALGHTWSLAVEEQFYLVWPPALILIIGTFGLRGLCWASGGLVVFGTLESILRSTLLGHSAEQLRLATDTNGMIGLMVGCFVAAAFDLKPVADVQARARFALLGRVSAGAIAATMVVGDPTGSIFVRGGYTAVAVLTAVVLLSLVHGIITVPAFDWPLVAWIGRASYGIYLFHVPVLRFWYHLAGENPFMVRLLALLTTALVSAASLRWFEAPLRRRFAVGNGASRESGTGGVIGKPDGVEAAVFVPVRLNGWVSVPNGR